MLCLQSYEWDTEELVFTVYRLVTVALVIGVEFFSRRWSMATEKKIGKILFLMTLFGYFITCTKEFWIKQHDTQFMYLHIWSFFFSGIVTSSFSEYLASSIMIASSDCFCSLQHVSEMGKTSALQKNVG
jgi:hypothetical protein